MGEMLSRAANTHAQLAHMHSFANTAEDICQEQRAYDYAKLGLPLSKVAHYVELNFYPDKELLVSTDLAARNH